MSGTAIVTGSARGLGEAIARRLGGVELLDHRLSADVLTPAY